MKTPRSKITRAVAAFAFALLLPLVVWAESDFERGNSLYESGKFADAAKAYERAAQGGAAGPNLYYNLGNAWLRAGDQGHAVLNYQRALALRPAHPEAAANLAFVRRTLGLAAPAMDRWTQAFGWLGVDAWSIVAAIGVWAFIAGIIAIFGPWRRALLAGSLIFLGTVVFAVGVVALLGLRGGARDPARAIVVSESGTKAHYAPADNARDVQVLAVGSEIRVLQDRGNWTYAEVAGGVRGWVATADLGRVVPN
ncbi:hypothetical protein AYO41_04435 [Verrucomicrobia bacterium SCGC AG-212-E04]|nr:hypothetical protein AYO41_04435 [Verrucomicrobia bacterium SCGC AG-212-E04]